MSGCNRCEILPNALPETGVLYIAPPAPPVTASICGFLRRSQIPYSQPYPDIYEIRLGPGVLVKLVAEHLSELSQQELNDTKCLLVEEGAAPTVPDMVRMQPLSGLLARIQGDWLLELLREDRLRTVFQPVVEAADASRIYGYECLIRGLGSAGELIPPTEMFRLAKSADLLFHLDRLTRLSVIRDVIRSAIDVCVFINFVPSAVYVPQYCLESTVTALSKSGIPNSRVVFEVVETDDVRDIKHLVNVLSYYRENGFRIALDDLGAGYSSLRLLYHLKPDFIKVDADLIRHVDQDEYKANIAANLLDLARKLGIKSIAEGVETHEEWDWVKAHGADYMQGFLFAKPDIKPPVCTQSSVLSLQS